jgi:hypothetical protein
MLKYLRTQFHFVAELPIMEAADDGPKRQVGISVLRVHPTRLDCALTVFVVAKFGELKIMHAANF